MRDTIDIAYIKANYPDSINGELGDDLLVFDFDGETIKNIENKVFEADAYILFYCRKGNFDIVLNMEPMHVVEDTLLVNKPGNIFKICGTHSSDLSFLALVISRNFFSEMNIDYNRLFNESLGILTHPCQVLDRQDINALGQFFKAGAVILPSSYDNKREIIGEIIGAASYLLSSIWSKKLKVDNSTRDCTSRETAIFDDFLRLVTQYHLTQRAVGFYADKLFITPKYLSKIVKSVSGLSAPDWINKMIIMQAKSLLKYSDLTITEIVWKLRFSNPSVFYKYFKRQTGFTPTEYRTNNGKNSL